MKGRKLLLAALVVVILVLAQALWVVVSLSAVQGHAVDAVHTAMRMLSAPPNQADAASLVASTEALESSLGKLHTACWWGKVVSGVTCFPRLAWLGRLAWEGTDVSRDLATSCWWVALETQSALELSEEGDDTATVARQAAMAALAAEGERLDLVSASLDSLAEGAPSAQEGGLLGRAEEVLQAAALGIDLLEAAPALVTDPPSTVLVVLQNDDELRPTGGFISSVAEISVGIRGISIARTMDSYGVEAYNQVHAPAPGALSRWMGAGVLLFRDANWSPGFPQSADVLAALYAADMGRPVDLVVAVNTSFAEVILGAVGPVRLDAYGVTVTPENYRDVAASFWEDPLDAPALGADGQAWDTWLAHRKDISGALIEALLGEMGGLSIDQGRALLAALQGGMATKDILAWAPENLDLQEGLIDLGVDGGLDTGTSDYLMVVDANVGWNKVDRSIERSMDYAVAWDPEPVGVLTMTYRNTSPQGGECEHEARYAGTYAALTEGCYWDYTRVLLPQGAELIDVVGLRQTPDAGIEEGKQWFGGLVLVPRASEHTVIWRYRLPGDMIRETENGSVYRLCIQKQPGTGSVPVRIRILSQVEEVDSPWYSVADGYAWETDLETDMCAEFAWHDR